MRQRRSIGMILMLVLLLPIIVACGGGTTTTTTEPAAVPTTAAEPTTAMEATEMPMDETAASTSAGAASTLDLTALQPEEGATLVVTTWGDPAEQKINQDSFDRFTQQFPGVTITYQPAPSDFQTKLKADAAGSTLADVFYLDSSLMTAFAPNSILLDLTPSMETVGVNQGDYAGQLASIFVDQGKIYGLPKDQGALALFVNNAIAEQAGVDPASIKTWDDWQAAAEKMSSGDGNARVYGQCSSTDIQRLGAMMIENGVKPVTDTKANFNDPKAVEAVEFFYGLFRDKHAVIPGDIGSGWCGEAFGKGQVAMALEGGWMISSMASTYPDIEYTAIPLPTPAGGTQASLVFTNGWAAKADTQYPKAAAALVLYLTSAANQKPILETGFALPTVNSLLTDPYFDKNPNAKVLAEAGAYGTPADFAFGGPAKKDDVIKAVNTALERIWLGQGDVQSNLDQAVQEADQILSAQ